MLLKKFALSTSALLLAGTTFAAPISYWDDNGYTQIGDDDGVYEHGFVDPGWGGQDFDAEYMFFKVEENELFVGVQTGFDVSDGHIRHRGRDYFAGDFALSVDGDNSSYEYAIDFGWLTRDYDGDLVDVGSGTGIDNAGLYSVSAWNNDIYFNQSAPYAMDAGSFLTGLKSTETNLVGDSYYRTASFDLSFLGVHEDFDLDTHWTMSCGNDVVKGQAAVSVPEPATLPLLGLAAAFMIYFQRRRLGQVS